MLKCHVATRLYQTFIVSKQKCVLADLFRYSNVQLKFSCHTYAITFKNAMQSSKQTCINVMWQLYQTFTFTVKQMRFLWLDVAYLFRVSLVENDCFTTMSAATVNHNLLCLFRDFLINVCFLTNYFHALSCL